MTRHTGLTRQIVLPVLAVAATAVLTVLIGCYVFYALHRHLRPDAPIDLDAWLPTGSEITAFAVLSLLLLIGAIRVALRLAQRILTPLNSLAESARRIAEGELQARAQAGDRSLGETARLVDDFNLMAERLQRANRNLVNWNAAVAHELRTPVTILQGRLQGLADGVFTPSEALFRNLLSQAEALGRLVEDLRVVSLAESGHLRLQLAEVDLRQEIETVASLMEPALRAAGMTLELQLAPSGSGSPPVPCDAARIRQALLALLENARRYAHPGRVWIRSTASAEHLVLSVQDEGPGLAPALAAQVFEAFRRGEDSRSRESGGTGLGLSVVRAIAQAHGGSVSYRDATPRGAIFDLCLPRQARPAPEAARDSGGG